MTTAELIAQAAAVGHSVTERQIERWRYAGILPAARQRGRGKSRGALWLHPPRAATALQTFLEIRGLREPLASVAVRMWLRGIDIPFAKLRRLFPSALGISRKLRRQVNRLGPVGYAEDLADRVMGSAGARERYGVNDEGGYERIQQALEVITNAFAPTGAGPSDRALGHLLRCFGYTAAENAMLSHIGVDMKTEMRAAVPLIGDADIALLNASEAELVEGRAMWQMVHELVERAKRFPENPVRDFVLRLDKWHDDCFGFACLLQSVRLARSEGVHNPTDNVRSLLETTRKFGTS